MAIVKHKVGNRYGHWVILHVDLSKSKLRCSSGVWSNIRLLYGRPKQ